MSPVEGFPITNESWVFDIKLGCDGKFKYIIKHKSGIFDTSFNSDYDDVIDKFKLAGIKPILKISRKCSSEVLIVTFDGIDETKLNKIKSSSVKVTVITIESKVSCGMDQCSKATDCEKLWTLKEVKYFTFGGFGSTPVPNPPLDEIIKNIHTLYDNLKHINKYNFAHDFVTMNGGGFNNDKGPDDGSSKKLYEYGLEFALYLWYLQSLLTPFEDPTKQDLSQDFLTNFLSYYKYIKNITKNFPGDPKTLNPLNSYDKFINVSLPLLDQIKNDLSS